MIFIQQVAASGNPSCAKVTLKTLASQLKNWQSELAMSLRLGCRGSCHGTTTSIVASGFLEGKIQTTETATPALPRVFSALTQKQLGGTSRAG